MGKGQSKHDELDKVKRVLEEKGVSGAQDLMRKELEGWNDVKVKIGVTGISGAGKSSFINAFRGLDDEDEGAAEVSDTEATMKPHSYPYRDNPNITLVDLPGIGTPAFPDLDTYSEKVGLETYDTFLILTNERFTEYDLELAKSINAMGKSFFLIRTKIDQSEGSENRKRQPDIKAMLERIRNYLYEYVKDFGIGKEKIFLISNHDRDKCDFSRLVEAILEALSTHQKEALTMSLRILSKDVLKRKVEVLRNNIWQITVLFTLALPLRRALVDLSGICEKLRRPFLPGEDFIALETTVLVPGNFAMIIVGEKAKFFRSQLGLPEQNSDEFKLLKPEFQERMRDFYIEEKKTKRFFDKLTDEMMTPLWFKFIFHSLHELVNKMEALSLDILEETARGN